MGVGRGLLELEQAPGRFHVVPANPLREPGARLDRVFQHILGDERSAALLHAHHAAARQFLERAPHRVAVDTKLLRHLGFGRQATARRVDAGADIALQPDGDLAP
jgi:hypothetical protein